MKTNYLLKSNDNKNKAIKAPFIFSAGFVLVLVLSHLFFPNFFFTIFSSIAKPFWVAKNYTNEFFPKPFDFFSSQNILINENESLKKRINELQGKILLLETGFAERANMDKFFTEASTTDRVLYRVLAKPPQTPYDTLVLDIGKKEGVYIGARVYSQGVLIGKIDELLGSGAKVGLFSSAGVVTDAEILRNGLSFPLRGKGGANFELTVPRATDVIAGDIFVVPSMRSSVIARVDKVNEKESDSFKRLLLSVPIKMFSLQWVEVEKK
ncbi:MAG: hypothetical protein CO184_00665 [Candidatus Zambryskibacteria bacterium CG_4_9_14_3_um_filter_40_16]|uniref:Rod shape-determining protein MreC beta-barrel core domain-containing protein n=2 Tax=Candidatus Zambryskiibacteriota TaxID=1817925 RepID=A0A2H0K649_9BACT|nr:MAG: hypothetical protein COV95_02510 [Candidatus Zambryskibacteria bacterium CG11_big_fil_rev_8_21_14_0_20_40_24]PJA34005.1 MAG: hypothetical protein CO184_00665 [Candidatus Zambryskibacteria bacterium CG_4_9_14_3_um_filter_40_16]